jgi:hypothetical protein
MADGRWLMAQKPRPQMTQMNTDKAAENGKKPLSPSAGICAICG